MDETPRTESFATATPSPGAPIFVERQILPPDLPLPLTQRGFEFKARPLKPLGEITLTVQYDPSAVARIQLSKEQVQMFGAPEVYEP
jgi:hypothetical protein